MTYITLPPSPVPNAETPRPVDGGSWQTPFAGGLSQRLERPGATHLAIDFTTPKIPLDGRARIWCSRLLRGIRQSVRVPYIQPEIPVTPVGSPVVNGDGQGGYALNVRGARPGLVIVEGRGLNVYDATGRAYLHLASADVTVDGSGNVTIPLEPGLRAAPADGSLVNLAAPAIEGKMVGGEKGITIRLAKSDGLAFTIEETR